MPRTSCPRAADGVERRGRRFGLRPATRSDLGTPFAAGALEWNDAPPERTRPRIHVEPHPRPDRPGSIATDPSPGKVPRLRYPPLAPEPNRMMVGIKSYLDQCGLGARLLDLVWLRTSLLNGCGYGIQAHSISAMAHGERAERLYHLRVGEESPAFTERERCAIAWTDAVTLIHRFPVPDQLFERVRTQFSEKEVVDLTWAIVAMNSWNRMAIAFRIPPSAARPAPVHSV
jgi:AhpD family alkylhydroperoxidase